MKKAATYAFLILALAATTTGAAEMPASFDGLYEHYAPIHRALVNDTLEGVEAHAAALGAAASELADEFSAEAAGVPAAKAGECGKLLPEIAAAAGKLATAGDLAAAREAFGEVSRPMIRFREMLGGEGPVVVYCSMAKKAWLQPDEEIGNPYYGQSMARCGEVVSE